MKLINLYRAAVEAINVEGAIGFGTNVAPSTHAPIGGGSVQVDALSTRHWRVIFTPADQTSWPTQSGRFDCDGSYEGFLLAFGAAAARANARISEVRE